MEEYINKKIIEKIFSEDKSEGEIKSYSLKENKFIVSEIFSKNFTKKTHKNLLLLLLCDLSYKYNTRFYEMIYNWGESPNKYQIYDFDKGELVFITYKNFNTYVLAFKGSSSLKDYLMDIMITRTSFIKGKIHKGFNDILQKDLRYIKILNLLRDIPNDMKIILTGHSLGASLASIIYSMVYEEYGERVELVTFGMPRTGNKEFCKNLKSTRIVNKDDAVTKLPLPLRFSHMNTLKQIDKRSFFLKYSIADHKLEAYYIKLLEEI